VGPSRGIRIERTAGSYDIPMGTVTTNTSMFVRVKVHAVSILDVLKRGDGIQFYKNYDSMTGLSIISSLASSSTSTTITHVAGSRPLVVGDTITVSGHTGNAANVAMNQVYTVATVNSVTEAVLTGTGMTPATYNTGTIIGELSEFTFESSRYIVHSGNDFNAFKIPLDRQYNELVDGTLNIRRVVTGGDNLPVQPKLKLLDLYDTHGKKKKKKMMMMKKKKNIIDLVLLIYIIYVFHFSFLFL
jgi:hypothetical protein